MPCASLKPTLLLLAPQNNNNNNNDEVEEDFQQIRRFSHTTTQPLIFFENKQKSPIPCHACRLPLEDQVCYCPKYKYLLHKSCADLPLQLERLIFHPHHTLTLVHNRSGDCRMFLDYSGAFLYECAQCNWFLDLKCAFSNPPTLLSKKFHPHPLALFTPSLIPQFNTGQVSMSTTVMIPPHPTYYCEGCLYVAHIHCMLSQIKHILEGECSEQESNGGADHDEEPFPLTVEEFLLFCNVDKSEEVEGVFKAYIRDYQGDSGNNPKQSFCSLAS